MDLDKLDTGNTFAVSAIGDKVAILGLPRLAKAISNEDALRLSAWLFVMGTMDLGPEVDWNDFKGQFLDYVDRVRGA